MQTSFTEKHLICSSRRQWWINQFLPCNKWVTPFLILRFHVSGWPTVCGWSVTWFCTAWACIQPSSASLLPVSLWEQTELGWGYVTSVCDRRSSAALLPLIFSAWLLLHPPLLPTHSTVGFHAQARCCRSTRTGSAALRFRADGMLVAAGVRPCMCALWHLMTKDKEDMSWL